jgi:hypothetical protein
LTRATWQEEEDAEIDSRRVVSYESSPSRDDRLLFLISLACLLVACIFAALWVLVEIDFTFVWFILGTLGLGVVLLAFWALR